MSDNQNPIFELRKRARETYDISLQMAVKHMAQAEKTDTELSTDHDMMPTMAAQGRRASHIRMAEVYAQIAQACQKVPGQQF